jgi:hypothetical protein
MFLCQQINFNRKNCLSEGRCKSYRLKRKSLEHVHSTRPEHSVIQAWCSQSSYWCSECMFRTPLWFLWTSRLNHLFNAGHVRVFSRQNSGCYLACLPTTRQGSWLRLSGVIFGTQNIIATRLGTSRLNRFTVPSPLKQRTPAWIDWSVDNSGEQDLEQWKDIRQHAHSFAFSGSSVRVGVVCIHRQTTGPF